MWSVITKIFTAKNSNNDGEQHAGGGDIAVVVGGRPQSPDMDDTFVTKQVS